jgi:hypothetical protein
MAADRYDRDPQDDGRTVADMSDVRRPSLLGLDSLRSAQARKKPGYDETPSRDFADELQSPEERRMVIWGALRAALSLWMVYVIVFGIVIAAMLAFWN